jgi:hypothetical protein
MGRTWCVCECIHKVVAGGNTRIPYEPLGGGMDDTTDTPPRIIRFVAATQGHVAAD